jgi:alkyl hydroperoxide reductase subunit AhpC
LQQYATDLDRRDVKVVVVTFEAGFLARAYIEDTGLRWPLLIDANRELYWAYGMLTAGFWDIWGPGTWWAYFKEFARGRLPVKSGGDFSQRGGNVLVDPGGIVRFHHVGQGPGDRPSAKSLLRALDREQRLREQGTPAPG